MRPLPRREIVIVALIAFSSVLNQVDRQALAILKPIISADLGWSDGDYAAVVSYFQGATAVGLLFSGWIVDRLSLRSVGLISITGCSLLLLAHGWLRTVAQACMIRAAMGTFRSFGVPGGLRILGETLTPANRPIGFGMVSAASTLGGILAPLSIPLLALQLGWRGTFVTLGLVGLVWVATWFTFFRNPPASPSAQRPSSGKGGRIGIVLANARYRRIAFAKAISDLTWWQTLFWMPDLFYRHFGLSVTEAGAPIATVYVFAAVGSVAFGATINRMSASGVQPRRAQLITLAIALACVLPLPATLLTPHHWIAAILLGVVLFGHQGFSTTVFAITADEARPGEMGRLVGLCAFCGNIGGTLIVSATGALVMAGMSFLPIFIALPFAYALSLLLFYSLPTQGAANDRDRAAAR